MSTYRLRKSGTIHNRTCLNNVEYDKIGLHWCNDANEGANKGKNISNTKNPKHSQREAFTQQEKEHNQAMSFHQRYDSQPNSQQDLQLDHKPTTQITNQIQSKWNHQSTTGERNMHS